MIGDFDGCVLVLCFGVKVGLVLVVVGELGCLVVGYVLWCNGIEDFVELCCCYLVL